jgi:deoxycytidylate deaminase
MTGEHIYRTDLVFGLVGALGTDFDEFNKSLDRLVRRFCYEVIEIHLSHLLDHVDLDVTLEAQPEDKRIESYMNAGDRLREVFGRGDAVSRLGVVEVIRHREDHTPGNTVYVFSSLKHPAEVSLLRDVYGDSFFLIGIYSAEEERRRVLGNRGIGESDANRLMERDEQDDQKKLGQRTRDTFELADVFVRLTPSTVDQVENQVGRFLDLLFGAPVRSPLPDEHAMYLAYAASLRSADLSRQVGASITSVDGDIIGVGANDVPQAGGGLYWPGKNDQRDHARRKDSNELRKVEIARDIFNLICEKERVEEGFEDFIGKLRNSLLFDITEYGRAVHAEMEALLSCARTGASTRGGTLYATTFPCHNCAKHIIASGIKRVVYVEPYPKSQALTLHDDAIAIEEPFDADGGATVGPHKVIFEPYIGIGPRRYLDLFSMKLSSGWRLRRKEEGRLIEWDSGTATPRVPTMEPVKKLEQEAVTLLKQKLEGDHEGKKKD